MTSKKKNYLFDRSILREGYTQSGIHIPGGGVVLNNGTLAGYILDNDTEKLKWRIMGKVDRQDPLFHTIPLYQTGGEQPMSAPPQTEQNISLKSAVKLLREYYRTNFN